MKILNNISDKLCKINFAKISVTVTIFPKSNDLQLSMVSRKVTLTEIKLGNSDRLSGKITLTAQFNASQSSDGISHA